MQVQECTPYLKIVEFKAWWMDSMGWTISFLRTEIICIKTQWKTQFYL